MSIPSTLEYRVSLSHDRVRRRALAYRLLNAVRRRTAMLLPFEAVAARLHIRERVDRGYQTVPLRNIIGSEGRHLDFDRLFLPLNDHSAERWRSIARAHFEDRELPPVELYKLSQTYFVRDGHHRISVARERGQVAIDAHVIELMIDVPLAPDLDLHDLSSKEEQSDFFEWTDLARLRPGATIEISTPCRYLELIAHINRERRLLRGERGTDIAADEAITHWYDTVYLPAIRLIERTGLRAAFPGRTDADLYVEIYAHRQELIEQRGERVSLIATIVDYVMQYGSRRARRHIRQHVANRRASDADD